jgi:hypothetical protein
MVATRVRPSCAKCARRTDYCDGRHDRAEFPGPWPFEINEPLLPHLDALPASPVLVSACSAGHDVYALEPPGPCADFIDASGQGWAWPFHAPRSMADHIW